MSLSRGDQDFLIPSGRPVAGGTRSSPWQRSSSDPLLTDQSPDWHRPECTAVDRGGVRSGSVQREAEKTLRCTHQLLRLHAEELHSLGGVLGHRDGQKWIHCSYIQLAAEKHTVKESTHKLRLFLLQQCFHNHQMSNPEPDLELSCPLIQRTQRTTFQPKMFC